jgi:predicted alpha/beta-fold hydrolase
VLGHWFQERGTTLPTQLRTVALPDGDRLALHDSEPPGWRAAGAVVVLVHGLGGSHLSGYIRRMARRFFRTGIRVMRMDLRGVGAGETLARRTYHGGCSADLQEVVDYLQQICPASRLVLVGMSLGGNIVLKLAGETADRHGGLWAVAAVAPPIDMVRCARMLACRSNRLYERYFVGHLVRQVRRHQRHFPDLPKMFLSPRLTLRQFDDRCTAPRWGFAGAQDYYERASALPWLDRIEVPAFILTSRDDPFIAVEPFLELRRRPGLDLVIADRGGHLGFLGRDGEGGIRWAEKKVADWVVKILQD